MRMRKLVAPAAAILLALGLAGCQASVSADDVEEQIERQLSIAGMTPEEVECPDSLPAEVGAEMVCTATIDGEATDFKVTVTSVEDNTVHFDIDLA